MSHFFSRRYNIFFFFNRDDSTRWVDFNAISLQPRTVHKKAGHLVSNDIHQIYIPVTVANFGAQICGKLTIQSGTGLVKVEG